MPNQDATGPFGNGPSGRRFGPCSNKGKALRSGYYTRRGRGGRRGRFGGRYGPWDPIIEVDENDPETEKKFIENEIKNIERSKTALNKRLQELDAKK